MSSSMSSSSTPIVLRDQIDFELLFKSPVEEIAQKIYDVAKTMMERNHGMYFVEWQEFSVEILQGPYMQQGGDLRIQKAILDLQEINAILPRDIDMDPSSDFVYLNGVDGGIILR